MSSFTRGTSATRHANSLIQDLNSIPDFITYDGNGYTKRTSYSVNNLKLFIIHRFSKYRGRSKFHKALIHNSGYFLLIVYSFCIKKHLIFFLLLFRESLCLISDSATMGDSNIETPTSKSVVNDTESVIEVRRPVYHTKEFREKFRKPTPPEKSCKELMSSHLSSLCTCSKARCKRILLDALPFLKIMQKYKVKTDLPNDLIAGLTVGIMQLPQSKLNSFLIFTVLGILGLIKKCNILVTFGTIPQLQMFSPR